MSSPAPDEVRRVLAAAVGWTVRPHQPIGHPPIPVRSGADYDPRNVGPASVLLVPLPGPAADLNAMAAVEAEIHRQGRWGKYLGCLNEILHAWGWTSQVDPSQLGSRELWGLVTAPAAVRALAAYRVLVAAKDEG